MPLRPAASALLEGMTDAAVGHRKNARVDLGSGGVLSDEFLRLGHRVREREHAPAPNYAVGMCGRFALDAETDELIREFVAAGGDPQDWRPGWNIKPTDRIPVVFESARGGDEVQRCVELARWSLVPRWAREPKLKFPTFNARSEGVGEKATWRDSVPSRRCLIPASGYFEWVARGESKLPHFVHGAERLAFAGLYSWWRADDEADWMLTATILTMAAEPVPHMAALHDRLPVMLPRDWWDDWLAPDVAGDQSLVNAAVAAAIPLARRLEFHEVAPLRGDGPELVRPISAPAG